MARAVRSRLGDEARKRRELTSKVEDSNRVTAGELERLTVEVKESQKQVRHRHTDQMREDRRPSWYLWPILLRSKGW